MKRKIQISATLPPHSFGVISSVGPEFCIIKIQELEILLRVNQKRQTRDIPDGQERLKKFRLAKLQICNIFSEHCKVVQMPKGDKISSIFLVKQ